MRLRTQRKLHEFTWRRSDMKKCTYCGKEYPDTAGRCAVDHEPLIDTEPPPPKPEPAWHPKLIDLKTIPAAFEWCEGFSRPNWKVISETIEQNVSAIDCSEAWTEVAIQWAYHIREDLGGLFNVRRSQEFILVSSLDLGGADRLLDFA